MAGICGVLGCTQVWLRVMKALVCLLLMVHASQAVFGQGAVFFYNRTSLGDAPVTLLDGSGPGPTMVAGLYLVRDAALELLKVTPFREPGTDPRVTRFFQPLEVIVPGVPIRAPATFRVRVWDAKFPTYEAALSSDACCGEFRTTNSYNDVYVPALGHPNPPWGAPSDVPFLDGIQPLELPCLRSATNSNVLAASVKLQVRLNGRDRIALEVATSFPGESTVIEASEDLVSWLPVRTNTPGATWFAIEENIRSADSVRWYRAVVRAD